MKSEPPIANVLEYIHTVQPTSPAAAPEGDREALRVPRNKPKTKRVESLFNTSLLHLCHSCAGITIGQVGLGPLWGSEQINIDTHLGQITQSKEPQLMLPHKLSIL